MLPPSSEASPGGQAERTADTGTKGPAGGGPVPAGAARWTSFAASPAADGAAWHNACVLLRLALSDVIDVVDGVRADHEHGPAGQSIEEFDLSALARTPLSMLLASVFLLLFPWAACAPPEDGVKNDVGFDEPVLEHMYSTWVRGRINMSPHDFYRILLFARHYPRARNFGRVLKLPGEDRYCARYWYREIVQSGHGPLFQLAAALDNDPAGYLTCAMHPSPVRPSDQSTDHPQPAGHPVAQSPLPGHPIAHASSPVLSHASV